MNLNEIGNVSLATSKAKGFGTIEASDWDGEDVNKIPAKLALIHSEVTEALEEFRKEHRLVPFGWELADIIIRVAQLASGLGLDLDVLVEGKLEQNKTRPFKHGGRRI